MFAITARNDDAIANALVWAAVICAGYYYLNRRRAARTAFGTAAWATDKVLAAWGMLGSQGLILGRTAAGAIIRMPRYCHTLLVGGTGSGKGVSIIIPNLLDYFRGSIVVFDTKGDLYATTARRRQARGQRILRLAPFAKDGDQLNPLDMIPKDSPLLIDSAKSLAESLVVRQGTEHEPYWNNAAAQVIAAILVLVLLEFEGEERNLNAVQDIASDPLALTGAAAKLRKMGGIPARMGNQIKALFESPGVFTKTGASVMSTVATHLSFLDSQMVAWSVQKSTFDPQILVEPGVTLFLQIPPDQLEAQKGLLRCWISTLIRSIGSSGSEESNEVLFLLDEASALGSLSAVEEALVRGRSAGVRLILAYQSDSQVTTAFKDKPTLLYDNCSTQIYLCPPGSYETAERISKILGEYTQVVDSYNTNSGGSRSTDGPSSGSVSWGSGMNYAQQGRALKKPEEILTMNENLLIAQLRGMPGPVLARRVKWYEDAEFNSTKPKRVRWDWNTITWIVWLVVLIVCCGCAIHAKVYEYGCYSRPASKKEVIDGEVR